MVESMVESIFAAFEKASRPAEKFDAVKELCMSRVKISNLGRQF